MAIYRLYLLNRVTGHIARTEELVAGDDVSAICLVQARTRDAPMELWRDGRKISRFDGKPSVFDDHAARRRN